jgi:hypothetical protein
MTSFGHFRPVANLPESGRLNAGGARTILKVVFDTNALSNDSFDRLELGPMRGLCRRGRLVPVYGHVLIEETLRTYGAERRRQGLVTRRLPFLADTAAVICNDFIDIWHSELVEGRGVNARIYLKSKERERVIAALRNVPADGRWRVWHDSQEERDLEYQKRAAQMEIWEKMRDQISSWKKADEYDPTEHEVPDLRRIIDSNLDFAGRESIRTLVK